MVQQTQTRINVDDYYQLPEYEQHDLIQLIDGEVVIGMPPILKHQRIVRDILVLLTLFAQQHGGEAYDSPVEVRFDEYNVFEPDVLYIKPDNLESTQQDEKRIVGAPDLVVEVLSPSTAKKYREQKYKAYQRHRVGEYWIVDPLHDVIEVWTLGEDGEFKRQGAYDRDDTFNSVTLKNKTITVKELIKSQNN